MKKVRKIDEKIRENIEINLVNGYNEENLKMEGLQIKMTINLRLYCLPYIGRSFWLDPKLDNIGVNLVATDDLRI